MFETPARGVELCANSLLVCYSAGLRVLRQLAKDLAIDAPIMLHGSHIIAAQTRIFWPVFAKPVRICRADLMLTSTFWPSIPIVSLEEGIRTSQVKLSSLGHITAMSPMPCAEVYPGLTPVLVGECGPQIVRPAGVGMLGHPDGYTAGANAWQQAIAGTMSKEDFLDYPRRPENVELRCAIEKWGYIERPKSLWLRMAPPFHPKRWCYESRTVPGV